MRTTLLLFAFTFCFQHLVAQEFTRKDSLQGGLSKERTCYNVLQYGLNIEVNPVEKSIKGYNKISFQMVEKSNKIQIDLFENMTIDSIVWERKKLNYTREFNAVFIDFSIPENQKMVEQSIYFYYHGKPTIAKNAPWDGGFVWKKDSNGNPFVGVAVQGTGASLWYPCKDSQSDEPDNGAFISVTIPKGLMAVCNGKLIETVTQKTDTNTFYWQIKNPINNYNITLNIANYVHIHDNHNGLDLDYFVLRQNESKAKIHFEEVKPMLDCFQTKFGEFPFKNDGYKLVETPYLGMEHQSCIAYGNKYLKGYLGNDLSGTGVGLKFDYIIIHESGHEWFGNSITSKDIADMWIHEGFTQYTEIVYVECTQGYKNAQKYCKGLQRNVANDRPIIGNFGVNHEGSGDMYPKGALLLNTLRHVIDNDDLWWKLIYKYSTTFRHQIIDTKTVISFFNTESKSNLTPIFNQYLQTTTIPELYLKKNKRKLEYQWKNVQPDFNMPIDITINGAKTRIYPTTKVKKHKIKTKKMEEIEVPTDKFYVTVTIQ